MPRGKQTNWDHYSDRAKCTRFHFRLIKKIVVHATSQRSSQWYLIKLSFITAWIPSGAAWYEFKRCSCVRRASSKTRGSSQDGSLLRPPQWAWEDEGEGHRSYSSSPANSQHSSQLLQPAGTDTDNRWEPPTSISLYLRPRKDWFQAPLQ